MGARVQKIGQMFESFFNSYLFPFFHHGDTEKDRDCTEGRISFFARAKKEISAAKRGN